jgi:protein tyrosine phosphatase
VSIKTLKKIFTDSDLQHALFDGKKTVKEKDVASKLLKSSKREKLIPLFLDALTEQHEAQRYTRTSSRLIKSYESRYDKVKKKLPKSIQKQSEKTVALFHEKVTPEKSNKPNSSIYKGSLGLDKFPKENLTLKELAKRAKDTSRIKKLYKEIKERCEVKDKDLQSIPKKDAKKKENKIKGGHTYPYDFNRAGKNIKGLFVNASEARLPKARYILSGHPHTSKLIGNFFDVILSRNVKLIITVNQPGEGGMCPAFWTNTELSKAKMRDGWTIKHDEKKKTIAEGSTPSLPDGVKQGDNKKKWIPKIVERELVATDGKTKKKITHLHYENWHDHKPAPDIELLEKLLDKKDKLHKNPKIPFSINCRGGIGRTGTVALADLCRREIDAQRAKGKKLDKIKLNIPELLYNLRKQRSRTLSHPPQLVQVYQLTALYYDRLRKKS